MPLRRSMSQSGTNCHAMSLQIVSKKMIFVSHELELTIITGTTECSISMWCVIMNKKSHLWYVVTVSELFFTTSELNNCCKDV